MFENEIKPSILLLGSVIAVGGAQEVQLLQARWFQRQGYRVQAAFFWDREGLYEEWKASWPVPLINLGAWRDPGSLSLVDRLLTTACNLVRLLRALARLYLLLRREKFTVVETFTHHANVLGLPIAWAARRPVRLATHHGSLEQFSGGLATFHRWLVNRGIASRLVVVSDQARQDAIRREGILPERIVLIPNGIEPGKISTLSETQKAALRAAIGVDQQDTLVLSVGRLAAPKGHSFLLEAIYKIRDQSSQVVFILVGDGLLRQELQAKAQQLGIQDQVRFLGRRTDVPDLLGIADLFVLPSVSEGLPVALLEAMSAGVPVIATSLKGVEDVLKETQAGWLVPPANPDALSDALLQLLADVALRQRLGKLGKELVMNEYTVDKMCARYAALFQEILF
jgi:glycosyltransferase involved in cell wall biosynthesis